MADAVYQELVTRIKGDISQLESAMKRSDVLVSNSAKGWQRNFGAAGNAIKELGLQVGGLSSLLAPVIGAVSVGKIIRYSDAWKGVENRLKLVTNSTEQLTAIQERLFNISQTTRSDLDATVALYQRLTFATKGLGISQQEILTFTEQLNKQLLVGGLSATETRTSIFQLTQAFNKGKLDGDEFRTILESAPPILEALQQSLGKTRGEILAMAAAGKLGPRQLVDAVNSMADVTDKRFANLSVTIDQAFTQLQNAFTKFIGQSDDVNGAAGTIAGGLQSLAENMDFVGRAALALGAVLGVRLAVGLVAALAAMNPYAAALAGIVGTLAYFGTKSENAADSADEFTASLKRQETVLGQLDTTLENVANAAADAYLKILNTIGLLDDEVLREAELIAASGGRASQYRPRTVDQATFSPNKEDLGTPPVIDDQKLKSAREALQKYVAELYKQQEMLKLTARDQVGVEAGYRAIELAIKAKIDLTDEEIRSIEEIAKANYDLAEQQQENIRFTQELKDQFAETAGSILRDADSAKDALARLGNALADMLAKRYILGPLADSLFGAPSNPGGGLLSGLGGFFDGFFADGGTIKPGRFGIVGEDGPELAFAGSSPMNIVPMKNAGGTTVINNTLNAYPGLQGAIQSELARAMPAFIEMSKNAVYGDIQRGGQGAKIVGQRS